MVGSMGKRQVLAAAAGGAAALFAVGSMFLWGLWEAGGQGEPAASPGEAISPSLSAVTAPDTALPDPPGVSAASACVMTGSGTLLYEKDGDSFRSIASTTKIITALLTLELGEGQLDETFHRRRRGEGRRIRPRDQAGGGSDAAAPGLGDAPLLRQRRGRGRRHPAGREL